MSSSLNDSQKTSDKIEKKKRALIVGVANDHSIAWGIAQSLHQKGYELAFTFLGDALERRVKPLAESVNSKIILPLDIREPNQLAAVQAELEHRWGSLDALLHSVAFADRKDLDGGICATSKEGFLLAMEVSVFSLLSLTQAMLPLLEASGQGSVLTLSYYGAEKVVPNYNVMGVAKAALEAQVRYMAYDLGPKNIRVNALSAGPVRTLAAAGIKGFKSMMQTVAERAPLKRNVTLDEVGRSGAFLLDQDSSGITGETLYVDSGYNILGM